MICSTKHRRALSCGPATSGRGAGRPLRALPHTTGKAPAPWLRWASVSVERRSQSPSCPSSVPVCRSTSLQPPPWRSCGGRLRQGHRDAQLLLPPPQALASLSSPPCGAVIMSTTGLDHLVTIKATQTWFEPRVKRLRSVVVVVLTML